MTAEDIKRAYSMRDILSRYGLQPNRAGFLNCPFHQGDRTASLKVYKDSFYCFGCGATGDIFKFIQMMDHCDFKTAFLSLGGSYDHTNESERRHKLRDLEIQRRKRERERQEKLARIRELSKDIDIYRTAIQKLEPLSDAWCYAMNHFEPAYFEFCSLREELTGMT